MGKAHRKRAADQNRKAGKRMNDKKKALKEAAKRAATALLADDKLSIRQAAEREGADYHQTRRKFLSAPLLSPPPPRPRPYNSCHRFLPSPALPLNSSSKYFRRLCNF
jgi:hypothetical protein